MHHRFAVWEGHPEWTVAGRLTSVPIATLYTFFADRVMAGFTMGAVKG